jgi:hypothetical protein
VRLFTSPVTPGAVERRLRRTARSTLGAARPLAGWARAAIVAGAIVGLGWSIHRAWDARTPWLTPRHRPEALCFALARPPAFGPPMAVQPNAAVVAGHFPADTPPVLALQETMHFGDEMVADAYRHRVGDFDVTSLWVRLPEAGGPAHWLLVAWIENGDLAVCSFRFDSRGPVIPAETRVWGNRLLRRILIPAYFAAGAVPEVRLRLQRAAALPAFGPGPQD